MASERESTEGGTIEMDAQSFEALKEKIEKILQRGEKIGVESRFLLENNNPMGGNSLARDADKPTFAASEAKVPFTALLIDTNLVNVDDLIEVPRDIIDTSGGGIFDDLTAPSEVTVGNLLEDMLMRSGNTAYRVLAQEIGGPAAINFYYQQKGWRNSQVRTGDKGRAAFHNTTAREVLNQLKSIVESNVRSPLRDVAVNALQKNMVTKHGIRQAVRPTSKLKIMNKTGEHPGRDQDDKLYRHDVGFIQGPGGALWYAIMTTSNPVGRGYIADQIVAQVGENVALAVGATDIIKIGHRVLNRLRT